MEQQLPATEITALLGRGTQFEGKLHFEGRVRIDGVFKGEIRSEDTLVIGEGAEVHAEIDVATVIVRGGIVNGNIRAKTAIEVYAPGKIVGNLHSPSLFIDRGVEFHGSCRMDSLEVRPRSGGAGDVPSEVRSRGDVPSEGKPALAATRAAAPILSAPPSSPAPTPQPTHKSSGRGA
jgi:cytoskeletal protein CcmA (bactofilin family)